MREDIQCLRGISALFVLCFHLFPTVFVNGFLGVDIVFVVSGYLMAQTLAKSKIGKVRDFFTFYYKRFKRILPLHFLVVLVTLILVHLFFGEFRWEENQKYGLASLFCATNQMIIHDGNDYFQMLLTNKYSMNAFTHMWSLSVEIQFYLIVPFIFFGLQFLNNDRQRLITVSALTAVSFIASFFVEQQFSFNFMLLRFWQFSVGFVVLYWNRLSEHEEPPAKKSSEPSKLPAAFVVTKEDVVSGSVVVLSMCCLPTKFHPSVFRPFVTVATALVLAYESENNKLLKSSILSYLGDISLAVYLIHWPIISLFLASSPRSYVFCVASTLVISAFLHNFYEKRYLKLSVKPAVLLMVILLFVNGYLQQSVRRHNFWRHTLPSDLQSIIERNNEFLPNIWSHQPQLDPCEEKTLSNIDDRRLVLDYCRFPKTNGHLNVMMIGNSYVLNFSERIRAQFRYNYLYYKLVSLKESYGLYSDSVDSKEALRITKQEVEAFKPDILFIVTRYSDAMNGRILEDDPLVKQMKENIAFYGKIVKKIYILEPHPVSRMNFLDIFLHYATQRPEELDSLHLNKKMHELRLRHAKSRFKMLNCPKCRFFDIGHVFLEHDQYLTFDRDQMLSYVDNSLHLTAHGVKRCEPVFKEVVQEIMKKY